MEEDSQADILKVLLDCITAINASTQEDTTLEGIYSGRQVAQALITIDKNFAEDCEFIKIAEYLTDEEISQEVRLINYQIIISKLSLSFDSKKYDYNSAESYKFEPSDIVERRDNDSVMNLLITILTATFLKEIQVTNELKYILDKSGDVKKPINDFIKDLTSLITMLTPIERESGGRFIDNSHFKRKEIEWNKKEEIWRKKEEEYRTNQIQLQTKLEASVRDVENYFSLKDDLANRDAKIKHLEMLQADSKEQERNTQTTISNMEFENDKNLRKLKQLEESLHIIKREKQDLIDEIENRSINENKTRMEIKRLENKIIDIQTQNSNSQNDIVSRLQKELETSRNRIQYFITQITEMESQKDTILNLEQRLENNKHQLLKTNMELDAAVARACQAEAKLQQTEFQLQRKSSSDEEIHSSLLESVLLTPTLQDELNLSLKMHQTKRDENEDSLNSLLMIELKTKNEQHQNHINQLMDELKESKELYEKLVFSTDIRIAAEKEKAERIEEERQKSMKNVKDLESVKLRYEDKITKLEEVKKWDTEKIQKLERHIDSARMVICTYSSVSEGRESSAENLKLQNEIEKLQKEVENLRLKMDQYRCEACQEQRIITSNWYDEKIKNFALIHGLGSKVFKDSMINSFGNSNSSSMNLSNQSTPINQPKSFITRQLNIK